MARGLGLGLRNTSQKLGPGIKQRFEFGSKVEVAEYEKAAGERLQVRLQLEDMLGDDGLLIFPTVPSAAPLKSEDYKTLHAFREHAIRLLCLSGLSGLPQITLPLAEVYGAPMGISLMGPRGSDKRLIEIARGIMG